MTLLSVIIDGSRGGREGNTSVLLDRAASLLATHGDVECIHLEDRIDIPTVEALLTKASIVLIGSGTYWDSWGSPLQQFLEQMTHTEGSPCWLGKAAGVVITMHSVGGKGVLSRLQGVLSTFGCVIPPMGGLVYSATAQVALQGGENAITEDLWRPSDLEILCHNLVECAKGTNRYRAWPIDRQHFSKKWIEI